MLLSAAFASRLRDLLATLESASLLGSAEGRVRGLGEQLRFACLALPCDEAVAALELESLSRLIVPAVANGDAWQPTSIELDPSGTPFAYLIGGGGGHAVELMAGDPFVETLAPVLRGTPRFGAFVPIRLGDAPVGGAALLSHGAPISDRQLDMAERLAEVLALTVEAFRTERVLFEIFARALPDLLAKEATTGLRAGLERAIHGMRLTPEYRRRLELAVSLARVSDRGDAETRLAAGVLERVDEYLNGLERGAEVAFGPEGGE